MIKKPSNYDETAVGRDWTPVELGGHYATIVKVAEGTTKGGKQQVVIAIDFSKDDKQAGYFMTAYKADDKKDKKWPYNGIAYVMVYDYQDDSKTNRNFKSFCVAVENSNKGFSIKWEAEDWGTQFKGKKVGVVFGAEENEYNGKVSQLHKIRWFCDYDRVPDQKIPKLRELRSSSAPAAAPAPAPSIMDAATPVDDVELPF